MSILKTSKDMESDDNLFKLQQFALDNITEALFLIDENANLKYVNKSACNQLGYTNEELIKMSVFDINPVFSPDQWKDIWINNHKSQTYLTETKHRTKDGKIISVEINSYYFEYNGITYNMAFAKEISDIKQAKEEKNYLELQYRILFESSSDGIFLHRIIERNGKTNFTLHDLNQKGCELWGYSKEEIFGGKVDLLAIGDEPYSFEEAMRRNMLAASGKPQVFDWQIKHRDGTYVWGEVNLRRIQLGNESFLFAVIRDITERKQAGLQLEEAQAKLETVVSTIPDLLWLKNNDGIYLACNNALEQFFGKQESEILGKTDYDIMPKEGADLCKISDNEALACETITISQENYIDPQDKTEGTLEIRKVPVKKSDGETMGILGIARDITKNKRAKELLQKKEKELRALADSSPGMMASFHMREDGSKYMPYVSPNILDIFGLYPKDVATDASPLIALNHPDDAARIEESIAESARTMSIWHEEFRINHPFKGVRWLQSNTKPEPHPEGGVIWYGYLHDITEQKEQEKKLREKEQKFATFFNNSPVALAINDVETLFYIDANDNFLSDTGYTRDELIGKPIKLWHDKFEKERFFKLMKEKGFVKDFEFCYQRKDGTTSYASVSAALTTINGRLCIVSQSYDTSERRKKERLLQEVQTKLESIISTIPDMVWLKDMYGFYLACNPAFEEHCGKPESEIIGKTDYDLFTKEGAAICKQSDMDALSSNKTTVKQREFIYPHDGTKGMLEVRKAPIYNNGKLLGVFGIGRDITKNMKQKELLRQKEEEFRSLAENSPDAIVRYDLDLKRVYVNPAYARTNNITVDEALGESPSTKSWAISDMVSTYEEYLKSVIKSKKPDNLEFSYKDKNGEIRYLYQTAVPEFNSDGEVISILTAASDITEKKKQEKLLRQKEEEFRSLAENLPDNIARFDTEGRYLYINPTHERLLGMTLSEAIGTYIPDTHTEVKAAIAQAVATKEKVTIQQKVPGENGEIETHDVSITPEFGVNGEVISVLGIGRDVTSLYRMQDEIAAQGEQLRTLVENLPDNIIRYDKACRATYVSPTMEQVFGPEVVAGILGKTPTEALISDASLENYKQTLNNQQSIYYQQAIEQVLSSGEKVEIEIEIFPLQESAAKQIHHIRIVPERDMNGEICGALTIGTDITEKKEQAEKLQKTKAKLAAVISTMPDLIWVKDENGVYVMCNPAFENFFGAPADEIIGKTDYDFLSKEQADFFRQKDKEAMDAGEMCINEEEIVFSHNAQHALLETRKIPVYYGTEFMGVLGIGRDITERKKTEDQLLEQNQFLDSLHNAIPVPVFYKDTETKYKGFNKAFEEFYGKKKDELIGKGVFDLFPPEQAQVFFDADAELFRNGGTQIYETKLQDARGVYHDVMFHKAVYHDKAGTVAGQIGTILDITERKTQEEALKTSEQKFRTLIENATDNIIRYDKEARVTYINSQLEKVLGASSESFIGKTPTQHRTDGVYDQYEIELKKVIATGENAHTYLTLPDTREGEQYHYIHIVAERDVDGNIIGAVAFGRDITELTNKTIELQKSLEFNEGVIAAIPDLLFEIAQDGTYVGVWAQNSELLAVQKEMLLGNNFKEILPPDAVITLLQTFKEVDEKGLSLGNTFSLDLPAGRRWFELSVSKKKSSGNYIILSRDITERQQMQNILEKNRASLAEAQRVSHTGSWELNFETNELSWSDEVYRIFEIDKNEFSASYEGFLQAIHPDDRDMVNDAFTESLEKQMPYEIEHRLLMSDGRIKHVLERGETQYSDEGKPLSTLGIVHDFTERKEIEEKLLVKEREFRALAEHTPDTIARYNQECIRLYANPAFAKAVGVEPKELLGKKPTTYSNTEQARAYEKAIKQVFKSKKEGEIEYSWPDKNGHIITSHIRIVPEKDENGTINSVIATGRDITKLKKFEIKLQENQTRLKEAQKIAKIGNWVLEFPGLKLHWSDEVYRIFEIDSIDLESSYDHLLDIVHPDERAHVDAYYRSSIENKVPYDITYRILLKDGRIKFIHERGKTTYDDKGNPIQAIGTVQDVTEHKLSQKKIEHMAHHDSLTGLPNRLLAKQKAEEAIDFAKSNNSSAALIFLDLDGFKTINDSMGHYMGDEVIKIVASRIKNAIGENDIISRQGGDEFLIFLSDIYEKQNIMAVIEKLLYKFEKPFDVNGYALSTSASIGIALYPDHGDSFELLLQNADAAMYKAKENGKNTYCFYTEQMNHNIAKQFRIQNDLKKAVKNSEFVLYYQPQVDLGKNSVVGAEALIRWRHPELGMVPPMDFITVAESSGIIVQIGEWVINEACRQAAIWSKQGIDIVVAVNISAVQFKRGNLEEVVKNALYSSGLNPKLLELELTESVLINDVENVLKTVKNLKGLGVGLSIDDFGTGYSSLAYLKRFAVDKLKIDQSFIRGLLENSEDAAIVQTIVQMAKNFKLRTIAEGVENQEILDVVNSLGCDEVQGYHFAKPMEFSEFEEYFNKFM